jgi:hypothetical protein
MEVKKEKKLNKSLKSLPKLKQDIIKSVTQNSLNKKYGDLVENIIERKMKS